MATKILIALVELVAYLGCVRRKGNQSTRTLVAFPPDRSAASFLSHPSFIAATLPHAKKHAQARSSCSSSSSGLQHPSLLRPAPPAGSSAGLPHRCSRSGPSYRLRIWGMQPRAAMRVQEAHCRTAAGDRCACVHACSREHLATRLHALCMQVRKRASIQHCAHRTGTHAPSTRRRHSSFRPPPGPGVSELASSLQRWVPMRQPPTRRQLACRVRRKIRHGTLEQHPTTHNTRTRP